jgi:hypothetical protein
MGSIASSLGFYAGNNDDLEESFFSRSVLRHVEGGRRAVEPWVRASTRSPHDNPLRRLEAVARAGDPRRADVFERDPSFHRVLPGSRAVAEMAYLSPDENARYADQTVTLQRVFQWLARVPEGHALGARFIALPPTSWTWPTLGDMTHAHLRDLGRSEADLSEAVRTLAAALGCTPETLPPGVREHPLYFCFLPSGAELAQSLVSRGVFDASDTGDLFDRVGYETRQWLYDRALYRLRPADAPTLR